MKILLLISMMLSTTVFAHEENELFEVKRFDSSIGHEGEISVESSKYKKGIISCRNSEVIGAEGINVFQRFDDSYELILSANGVVSGVYNFQTAFLNYSDNRIWFEVNDHINNQEITIDYNRVKNKTYVSMLLKKNGLGIGSSVNFHSYDYQCMPLIIAQ